MANLFARILHWWSAAPAPVSHPVNPVAHAYLTYGPRVAREMVVRTRAQPVPKLPTP